MANLINSHGQLGGPQPVRRGVNGIQTVTSKSYAYKNQNIVATHSKITL